MHTLQISGHISESQAMDYIFTACRGNESFENRTLAGYDIEFKKTVNDQWLASVIAPNQERTVVAVAFVDKFDT